MRRYKWGDVRERFFRRFEIDPASGCWNWTGTPIRFKKSRQIYGVIGGPIDGVRYMPPGRQMLAHRASWILHNGPIPDGEGHHGTVVMHTCDNGLCVNPAHLRLGEQRDNVADMDAKARRVSVYRLGDAHPNAVLTAEQVAEIVASTETNAALAERFGVGKWIIKNVRVGKTYTTHTDAAALRDAARQRKGLSRPGVSNPTAKLTAEQVRYIRASTKTTYELADELGVTQPTVASARRRATYKDVN